MENTDLLRAARSSPHLTLANLNIVQVRALIALARADGPVAVRGFQIPGVKAPGYVLRALETRGLVSECSLSERMRELAQVLAAAFAKGMSR